jgi:hypothetical protein
MEKNIEELHNLYFNQSVTEPKMLSDTGGTCNMHTKFWSENLNRRNHLEGLQKIGHED